MRRCQAPGPAPGTRPRPRPSRASQPQHQTRKWNLPPLAELLAQAQAEAACEATRVKGAARVSTRRSTAAPAGMEPYTTRAQPCRQPGRTPSRTAQPKPKPQEREPQLKQTRPWNLPPEFLTFQGELAGDRLPQMGGACAAKAGPCAAKRPSSRAAPKAGPCTSRPPSGTRPCPQAATGRAAGGGTCPRSASKLRPPGGGVSAPQLPCPQPAAPCPQPAAPCPQPASPRTPPMREVCNRPPTPHARVTRPHFRLDDTFLDNDCLPSMGQPLVLPSSFTVNISPHRPRPPAVDRAMNPPIAHLKCPTPLRMPPQYVPNINQPVRERRRSPPRQSPPRQVCYESSDEDEDLSMDFAEMPSFTEADFHTRLRSQTRPMETCPAETNYETEQEARFRQAWEQRRRALIDNPTPIVGNLIDIPDQPTRHIFGGIADCPELYDQGLDEPCPDFFQANQYIQEDLVDVNPGPLSPRRCPRAGHAPTGQPQDMWPFNEDLIDF